MLQHSAHSRMHPLSRWHQRPAIGKRGLRCSTAWSVNGDRGRWGRVRSTYGCGAAQDVAQAKRLQEELTEALKKNVRCSTRAVPSEAVTRRPAPFGSRRVRASVRARACALAWAHGGWSRDGTRRGRERRRLLARAYLPSAYTAGNAVLRTTATAVAARVQNNDLTELNQTRKSLTETQDALQLVQARTTACPRRSRATCMNRTARTVCACVRGGSPTGRCRPLLFRRCGAQARAAELAELLNAEQSKSAQRQDQIQEQEGALCVLKAELGRLTPELETLREKASAPEPTHARRRASGVALCCNSASRVAACPLAAAAASSVRRRASAWSAPHATGRWISSRRRTNSSSSDSWTTRTWRRSG